MSISTTSADVKGYLLPPRAIWTRYTTEAMSHKSQAYVDRLVREFQAIEGEVTVSKSVGRAPSLGWGRGLCVDVTDLGVVPTKWGERQLVEFVWELEERRADGHRHLVWRRFGPSLNDHSRLRAFLEVWQGYPFTPDDLRAGVQLADRYIGRSALLLIEPALTTGGFRWVTAARPLPPYEAPVQSDGLYVRRIHRRAKKDVDKVSHDE